MINNINTKLITDGYYVHKVNESNLDRLKIVYNKIKNIHFKNAVHTECGNGFTESDNFLFLEELKKEYAPLKRWQYWYLESNLLSYLTKDEVSFLKDNIFVEILNSAYNLDFKPNISIDCTMYNKQCYIKPHRDGTNEKRICNILLYLNEDYKDGFGGELVINDDIIIKPEFGTIVVLDFSNVNPMHSVNEVLDDSFKRYALISQVYKSDS